MSSDTIFSFGNYTESTKLETVCRFSKTIEILYQIISHAIPLFFLTHEHFKNYESDSSDYTITPLIYQIRFDQSV